MHSDEPVSDSLALPPPDPLPNFEDSPLLGAPIQPPVPDPRR